MKDYRVTIDTLREQYEYEVEAEHDGAAERQALVLAGNDGLEAHARTYIKVEVLD